MHQATSTWCIRVLSWLQPWLLISPAGWAGSCAKNGPLESPQLIRDVCHLREWAAWRGGGSYVEGLGSCWEVPPSCKSRDMAASVQTEVCGLSFHCPKEPRSHRSLHYTRFFFLFPTKCRYMMSTINRERLPGIGYWEMVDPMLPAPPRRQSWWGQNRHVWFVRVQVSC